MIATDFTRYDCLVGKKRRTYTVLERDWRCNTCGGRLTMRWGEEYPENWSIVCLKCEGQDFVHEAQLRREHAEAKNFLEALAQVRPELAAKGGYVQQTATPLPLHTEPADI